MSFYPETGLEVFCPENNIYPGANISQFKQLEFLLKNAKDGIQIPDLGFFGEASTGKTMSAEKLAEAAGYLFIYLNSSSLNIRNMNILITRALYDATYTAKLLDVDYYNSNSNYKIYSSTKPVIILLDEAHELKKDVQVYLLSALSNKGIFAKGQAYTINTDNITWVLATTDPSSLSYPLTTRLMNITFDQYSKRDIVMMMTLYHGNITFESLDIIADCAKHVPRVALAYAKQVAALFKVDVIDKPMVLKFVSDFLGMEPNGIDPLDKRILLYLSNNKKAIKPVDSASYKFYTDAIAAFEKKGIDNLSINEHKEYNKAKFNACVLKAKIDNTEYSFLSRNSISQATRLFDLKDLETRLSFLEKLNYIQKSSKGIALSCEYLAKP